MNTDTAVQACFVLFAALDNIAAHDNMPASIWLQALKEWNGKHDKDTWAIPRKGTDYIAEVRKIMDALNAPPAPPVKTLEQQIVEAKKSKSAKSSAVPKSEENRDAIKKAHELVRERKKAFAEIKRATKGGPQGYAYENAKDQLYAAEHALAELLKAD